MDTAMAQNLTQSQLDTITIVERTSAVLSVTGTLFIILTFGASKKFRSLSGTLIFYASFGNILSNVAHLIAVDGVTAGPNSALCQFQAFLQQMFMPADSLWSLAMATNVYLAFFHRYDAESLRRLHWKYFVFCYGIPAIPALVYLFVKNSSGVRVYGGATLWCWVSTEWGPIRIATYYGPLWFIMFAIFTIYLRVGVEIYKQRSQLRSLYQTNTTSSIGKSQIPTNAPYREIHYNEPIHGTKTTVVQVTSSRNIEHFSKKAYEDGGHSADEISRYSVTISNPSGPTGSTKSIIAKSKSRGDFSIDGVLIAYTRCAALFAASLLITWVPSSANRVYGLIYPTEVSYALNCASGFVLPLQGFWNFVIYFVTSLPAIRELCRKYSTYLPGSRRTPKPFTQFGSPGSKSNSTSGLSGGTSMRSFEKGSEF